MGVGLPGLFSAFYKSWLFPQYGEQPQWLQKITPQMPGAQRTPAFDGDRKQTVAFSDGTFGVGLQVVDSAGKVRKGYLGPQLIPVAINDRLTVQQFTAESMMVYEGPVVYVQPPYQLSKGDVLVKGDVRYVVGDRIKPYQVTGQTILQMYKLEKREPADIVYQIPTT